MIPREERSGWEVYGRPQETFMHVVVLLRALCHLRLRHWRRHRWLVARSSIDHLPPRTLDLLGLGLRHPRLEARSFTDHRRRYHAHREQQVRGGVLHRLRTRSNWLLAIR